MFNSMRLQNFKAWEDTGPIRMAPLTVFFGGNSSGKSSLLQALLLLKQTAESPDRNRVLHLGGTGNTPIALGTMSDVVFAHEQQRQTRFTLAWGLSPTEVSVLERSRLGPYSSHSIEFHVDLDIENGQPVVDRLRYSLGDGDGRSGMQVWMRRGKSGRTRGKYALRGESFVPLQRKSPHRQYLLPPPVRYYGFPNEAIAYYSNTESLPALALALERRLAQVAYLGPLRVAPSRMYTWSGGQPSHVGWAGQQAVEAILAAKGRRISAKPRARYRPFAEVIARWLVGLGLVAEFAVTPIAQGREEHEVLIKSRPGAPLVKLTDVGFGVSQFLPVLVEVFYAPPGSTIILEQPELHLHPRVQAVMADLFIEAIRAREDGEERGIQLIVESHSEHFLRRLRRRIAEEVLAPDEVALYFAEAGEQGQGSTLSELQIDDFGNIANWPEDFFGDEMADMIAMTEAAMRRASGGGS